ncbi:AAA family ATPase [Nannocystis sp. SCPEA4]|uniref:bifunctional aminoglycoside phosphotransferase/ATP-binding protein n=1 Tax=Nannocystis sp. SCPEA4 TaxID=2996787 RepID=UPI00227220CB|nr:AAA family ATPase [Nannocystis sp. SCPEA4]MCY1060953.1 AAA family ATPase [Nannocystis sp. SCPEA4]
MDGRGLAVAAFEQAMELTALIAALSDPRAFGRDAGVRVEVVQTHVSVVFLVEDDVFKLKKPVDLEFLDYSTLSRRRHFCQLEVELNRRLAPDVYLGTLPIVQVGDELRVGRELDDGGDLEVIDWVVHMRRLPDAARLGSRIAAGEADAALMQRLGATIAGFHARARRGPAVSAWATFAAVAGNCRQNFVQLAPLGVVPELLLTRVERATEEALGRVHAAIDARARRHVPRDTHGDLRLEHVYWFPEREAPDDIVVIDCIEFGEQFRCADPVADLAFLVMDLRDAGRRDLAEALCDGYFAAASEDEPSEGRALLPLYVAYRATVRAKVEAFKACEAEVPEEQAATARGRARRYLLLALRELQAPALAPCLLLVMGLPGTGKSTLARALAEEGFVWVRSDAVRKQLAGLPTEAPADASVYTPAWTERTYEVCRELAEARLSEGERVVVDANFKLDAQRAPFVALAAALGVQAQILVCTADEATVVARLSRRTGDVSDADVSVYQHARRAWQPLRPEHAAIAAEIASEGSREEVLQRALQHLRAVGLW